MGIIRLLLAVGVFTSHGGPILNTLFPNGQVAVEAFFVISGFYMALVLNTKYPATRTGYFVFLFNRYSRLFPTFISVALLVLVTHLILYGSYKGLEQNSFASVILATQSHLFLIGQEAFYFLTYNTQLEFFQLTWNGLSSAISKSTYLTPGWHYLLIPQGWTIGVEMLCYICAPFLARQKISVLLIFLLVSLTIKLFLHATYAEIMLQTTHRSFLPAFPFFLIGLLSYNIFNNVAEKSGKPVCVLFMIFAVLICIYQPINGVGINIFEKNSLKQIAINSYLPIYLFFAIPFIFQITKYSKLDRFVGDLSYPFYLCHLFIINRMYFVENYRAEISFLLTIMLSVFLVLLIENRIDKYRQKLIKAY